MGGMTIGVLVIAWKGVAVIVGVFDVVGKTFGSTVCTLAFTPIEQPLTTMEMIIRPATNNIPGFANI